jgi:hypothetical protein
MASDMTRRALFKASALAGGAALAQALAGRWGRSGPVWVPAAHANHLCFDPVPDPAGAGFVQVGSEPPLVPGSPLVVVDPSTEPGRFLTCFCRADDLFVDAAGTPLQIVLTPRVTLDPAFLAAPDGNTGVHVTINDGTRELRSVLLAQGPGGPIAVAIELVSGYSPSLTLPSLTADFTLVRRPDGSGILALPGGPGFTVPADALPASRRPGVPTVEFGTYDVGAASLTAWATLGLPPAPSDDIPFVAFDPRLVIQDFARFDRVRISGSFELAPGQTVDPTVDPVSITLSRPGEAPFWPPAAQPGTGFVERPRGWFALTREARAATGFTTFIIRRDPAASTRADFLLIDRGAMVTGNFSEIAMMLRLNKNVDTFTTDFVESPPGSGNWIPL